MICFFQNWLFGHYLLKHKNRLCTFGIEYRFFIFISTIWINLLSSPVTSSSLAVSDILRRKNLLCFASLCNHLRLKLICNCFESFLHCSDCEYQALHNELQRNKKEQQKTNFGLVGIIYLIFCYSIYNLIMLSSENSFSQRCYDIVT